MKTDETKTRWINAGTGKLVPLKQLIKQINEEVTQSREKHNKDTILNWEITNRYQHIADVINEAAGDKLIVYQSSKFVENEGEEIEATEEKDCDFICGDILEKEDRIRRMENHIGVLKQEIEVLKFQIAHKNTIIEDCQANQETEETK